MYVAPYGTGVGGQVASSSQQENKRSRGHRRTPSASTGASYSLGSPHIQSASYTHTANPEHAPRSPANLADGAWYPKTLPTPSHTPIDSTFGNLKHLPSVAAHVPSAHLAMKLFGFDHHNSEDLASDCAPSRQSMSSYGNDSPATPRSGAGDIDQKSYNMAQNGDISRDTVPERFECLRVEDADYRQGNPPVQLFRTESQAFADELYNPNQVYTSAPATPPPQQQQTSFLSPHRNLVHERLQTANLARSTSPNSVLSRERSPFRDGSSLAPTREWKGPSPEGRMATAAALRQQQKDQAARAEYARASLKREPTKTISPKDAILDYNGTDQVPLFRDEIPAGYKQHLGGTEQWQTNNFMDQQSTFGSLPITGTGQQDISFRTATPADNGFASNEFDFSALPPMNVQVQGNPFQSNYQAAVAAKANNYSEMIPPFPATIPSMETSISDAGLPQSSQESTADVSSSSAPQRPNDTRANTGTYTCTYHGCTQRFSSHTELQKHKRDYHRSQHKQHESPSSASGSESPPGSTDSPGPSSGSGMTSAAILARNSQTGPHKCTRVNPSTGKPCNTIFSRPYDLTRHEDTIHNNRKQKVRCPMCREEKTFSRNDALTRHMRVVHPEVEALGNKRSRRD